MSEYNYLTTRVLKAFDDIRGQFADGMTFRDVMKKMRELIITEFDKAAMREEAVFAARKPAPDIAEIVRLLQTSNIGLYLRLPLDRILINVLKGDSLDELRKLAGKEKKR